MTSRDCTEHPLFKVFGLQRSGTNLAQHLVETNFFAQCLDEASTGWKHGPVRLPGGTFKDHPVYFVLCVKNPYAWAVSCYRYFQRWVRSDPTMAPQFAANPSMSFEQFMRSPHYAFQSPIHRWNVMHRLWLSTLPTDRTLVVRQEDQLDNQSGFLAAIDSKFHFARRTNQIALTTQHIDVDRAILGPMNADYYRSRNYLLEYSAELIVWIDAMLDRQLMKQFDYPLHEQQI